MKKQKFKIGDIFEMPLKNNLIGYGRILKILDDEVLIETFDLECFVQNERKVVLTVCCWNDELKNGSWTIIGFEEIPYNYKISDFWGTRAIDNSYFKVIGNNMLSGYHENGEKRITITEKDINGLEKYGTHHPESVTEIYIERLNGGND